jgi:hypothetical protein
MLTDLSLRKSENDRQYNGQEKKKDKRIIKFKSQNHKHVFNKSKLKVVKRN